MFGLGMPELLVIGVIMLLLFGRRLPEVGKSLGKGIIEFKKGINGVEEEVNKASMQQPPQGQQSGQGQQPMGGYQQQTGQQYPQQQPNPYASQAMPAQNGYGQQQYPQQPYPQQYQQLPNQPPQVPQQAGPVGTVSRADNVH